MQSNNKRTSDHLDYHHTMMTQRAADEGATATLTRHLMETAISYNTDVQHREENKDKDLRVEALVVRYRKQPGQQASKATYKGKPLDIIAEDKEALTFLVKKQRLSPDDMPIDPQRLSPPDENVVTTLVIRSDSVDCLCDHSNAISTIGLKELRRLKKKLEIPNSDILDCPPISNVTVKTNTGPIADHAYCNPSMLKTKLPPKGWNYISTDLKRMPIVQKIILPVTVGLIDGTAITIRTAFAVVNDTLTPEQVTSDIPHYASFKKYYATIGRDNWGIFKLNEFLLQQTFHAEEQFTTSPERQITAPTPVKNKIVVTVEGNIGSGKSTFLKSFVDEKHSIDVIEEPVEKWRNLGGKNILKMVYQDAKKHSFMFQVYAMLTNLYRHVSDTPHQCQIAERMVGICCFIDYATDKNLISQEERATLDEWMKFCNQYRPNKDQPEPLKIDPDLIVYLRTSPNIALYRVLNRKRLEEKDITLAYLQELHELHENLINKLKKEGKTKIIEIDANEGYDSPPFIKAKKEILQYCGIIPKEN